jgi:hypothetical protein
VDLDVDRNHLNIKHVTSEDHKFRIQSSNANSPYAGANLTLASILFSALETPAQKRGQN